MFKGEMKSKVAKNVKDGTAGQGYERGKPKRRYMVKIKEDMMLVDVREKAVLNRPS